MKAQSSHSVFSWFRAVHSRILKPNRSARRSSRCRTTLTTQSESLEVKQYPAATVLATLSGSGVLTITGTRSDDHVEINATTKQVIVTAGEAHEQEWKFKSQKVKSIVFNGGDGNDHVLNSTSKAFTANGGKGNDTLVGGSSTNRLNGGPGHDVLIGDRNADRLLGGPGNDFLIGAGGNDSLLGEAGNDKLFGDAGRDSLNGGAGNDLLSGDSGNDVLRGLEGIDQLFGGSGIDLLDGGTGADTIHATKKVDTVPGTSKADRVRSVSPHFSYDSYQRIQGMTVKDLAPLIGAAIDGWNRAGIAIDDAENVRVRIADLPGSDLGWAIQGSDGKHSIWLDSNAAGKTWFVDSTPESDEEYVGAMKENGILIPGMGFAADGSEASRGVDLLSVIRHELGHTAGLHHEESLGAMVESLTVGVRLAGTSGFSSSETTAGREFERFVGMDLSTYLNPDPNIPDWQAYYRTFGITPAPATIESNAAYGFLGSELAGYSIWSLIDTLQQLQLPQEEQYGAGYVYDVLGGGSNWYADLFIDRILSDLYLF